MEQNPVNNTQLNNATPVANNQATPSPRPNTANQQGFQPQYQQQINPQPNQQPIPQQNTQQFTEQPVIINTCIHNNDVMVQLHSEAKKRYILITILAFIGLAICIINCFFSDSVAGSAFMCGFCFWLQVFTFSFMKAIKTSAQTKERGDILLFGAICQPVTYFYNNYFTCYNPQSQARFFTSYQNIVGITEAKDIYIITLKENLSVLIHKNGFNLGNAELFKAFIQTRVPITTKIKFK